MYDSRAGEAQLNQSLGCICDELGLDGMTLMLSPDGSHAEPGGWHYYDAGQPFRCQQALTDLLGGRLPLDGNAGHAFSRTAWGCVLCSGQHPGGVLVLQSRQLPDQQRALLRLLITELGLWQQHYWSLQQLREQNHCLRDWINTSNRPQLILNARGSLIEVNRAGCSLLGCEQAIRLDPDGRVQVCLGAARVTDRWCPVSLLMGEMAEARRRLESDPEQGALVMQLLPLRDSRKYWLLTLKDPDYQPCVDADSLACLFSLTPVEKELIILLGKGCNSQEIADYRHVSKETVRSTLKSIFHKTGCHRQGDLLLLMQAMS